ncbi:MAG: 1-deoxy-D-xylulose-5-phosphate reductoisomerase [Lachnospiraceae bacterium]|nr:1-deoxy-D-xylulose-5-phosphate reductoisomerase [Lachnospiraceae bacterium]
MKNAGIRNLCILGSTGSIGRQTLETVRTYGGFRIRSLAAKSSIGLLEEQIRCFKPEKVCVYDKDKAEELKTKIRDTGVNVLSGMEGLIELASDPENDLVVTALVGMIGIRPTIAAINSGCDVALANKETLVTAGHLIMPLLAEKKVRLFPIDSEHSAIFQCLQGHKGPDGSYPYNADIDSILLTASGGPFRGMTYDELRTKTAADALKHPNWNMGNKITIDSATMVNKALEVMEARWLFGIEPDRIRILIQPKSIIHSAVQFHDGSIIAQLGMPDMRLPIRYALFYPDRKHLDENEKKLDLLELSGLEFDKPDYDTFRGLRLGLDAIRQGGSICTVFNAANEFAVARFLEGQIGFTDIYDMIRYCMDRHTNIPEPSLEEILETERWTYETAGEKIIYKK